MLAGKRIFMAVLMQESNAFSPHLTDYNDFKISRGSEMLEKLPVTRIFQDAGCELIPSLMAYAVPGGRLKQADFQTFVTEIIASLQAEPVDGVWLYLHGALEVTGIGSGETALLQAIRRAIGWTVPVAIALDLHANNTPELIKAANVIVGYQTAPHTDEEETQVSAARLLLRCLMHQVLPHPVMVRIPMLITGERATTGVEPMHSLIGLLRQVEQDPGIWCASYFVGMAWVDTHYCGASIVITAEPGQEDQAASLALSIAGQAWSHRSSFHFEEEALPPEAALSAAMTAAAAGTRPVFLTDAGDNVTAGAAGDSAFLLQQALRQPVSGALFAGLIDRPLLEQCHSMPVGQMFDAAMGGTLDPQSVRIALRVRLLWQGCILDSSGRRQTEAALVRCIGFAGDQLDHSIDLIATGIRCAFTSPQIIESTPVKIADYSMIIVKQGYLYDALRQVASRSIMVLTPGSGSQNIETFQYQNVIRPVYPLDPDMTWQPGPQDVAMRA